MQVTFTEICQNKKKGEKIGSFVCALKAGNKKEKKNCVKLKYGCCG